MNRACVILGGDLNSPLPFIENEIKNADLVVGVDSGANVLKKLLILPDIIIGDMDSISQGTLKWVEDNKVEKHVYNPEKDFTDFQISMDYIQNRRIQEASILGAFGNRDDHFYGNLITTFFYSRKMKIILKTENKNCGFLYGENEFLSERGETWSFFPFGEKLPELSLKGFKYELNRKKLNYTNPLGVSNITVNKELEIIIHNDAPVLFFRYLGKII